MMLNIASTVIIVEVMSNDSVMAALFLSQFSTLFSVALYRVRPSSLLSCENLHSDLAEPCGCGENAVLAGSVGLVGLRYDYPTWVFWMNYSDASYCVCGCVESYLGTLLGARCDAGR